jgi:hypothetical protein
MLSLSDLGTATGSTGADNSWKSLQINISSYMTILSIHGGEDLPGL